MTNLNTMTTDELFKRVFVLNNLKTFGANGILDLTQAGMDKANQELVEIDAELDLRQPVGEFRNLYDCVEVWHSGWEKNFILQSPIGFEYLGPACPCGRTQKDCTFPYCEA